MKDKQVSITVTSEVISIPAGQIEGRFGIDYFFNQLLISIPAGQIEGLVDKHKGVLSDLFQYQQVKLKGFGDGSTSSQRNHFNTSRSN